MSLKPLQKPLPRGDFVSIRLQSVPTDAVRGIDFALFGSNAIFKLPVGFEILCKLQQNQVPSITALPIF